MLFLFLVVNVLVVGWRGPGSGQSGVSTKQPYMMKTLFLLLHTMIIIFLLVGLSTSEMYNYSLKDFAKGLAEIISGFSNVASTESF
jgi:hypothetical protein